MNTLPHSLPHLHSSLLAVPHGMFSRQGGQSHLAPFTGLNLSYYVGDTQQAVAMNRQQVCRTLGLVQLMSVKQIHSDAILLVNPSHFNSEPEGYDAMISTQPGVGLLIQQADCQAILLSCPKKQLVAAIHNGWRGSVQNIINKTIRTIKEHFGITAQELYAVISPSLGPCCAEFIHYQRELPQWMHSFQSKPNYFNFWQISSEQLRAAGIPATQIDITGVCTRCNRHYFSYRRAVQETEGRTGRNGSIIGLPDA